MRKLVLLLVLSLLLVPTPILWANNLRVQNVSLETRRAHATSGIVILVEFDVSWENSWRNSENYDAVWLIFKASIAGSGTLSHCSVYNDTSGYNLGNTTGSNNDLEFIFADDSIGVFLQRKASGTGTMTTTDARVSVNCPATSAQAITVRVIGIEMVYIPQGPFYVGDGVSVASLRKFSSNVDPWFIESEATITTTATSAGSYWYSSAGNTGESAAGSVFTIDSGFPKGYAAFYVMKYPVTEGQWVEFFNGISSSGKTNRDITASNATYGGKGTDNVIKRNTVSWSGSGDATTSREDRAMSYLGWVDLAAYLDWVGLRPMSELEYEKIARGPLDSVPGEYAWGSSANLTAGVTFSGSPEDGNEAFTSANLANANFGSTTFQGGDVYLGAQYSQGPVRPGIFATSSSSRERAGAGYYGVMDLTGNLYEMTVTIGNTFGTTYYAMQGDGSINNDTDGAGFARQLGWAGTGASVNESIGIYGVQTSAGAGLRDGAWNSASQRLRISDRTNASAALGGKGTGAVNRTFDRGGRGVRSVSLLTFPSSGTCGDGAIKVPEQCDDSNTTSGDGCSAGCECEDCVCAQTC